MQYSHSEQMQEISGLMNQRNFFGTPYIDRKPFLERMINGVNNVLSQDPDKLADEKNHIFYLSYNAIGFSRRLDLRLAFHVDPGSRQFKMTSLLARIGAVSKHYHNLMELPAAKEIEHSLHEQHKVQVLKEHTNNSSRKKK